MSDTVLNVGTSQAGGAYVLRRDFRLPEDDEAHLNSTGQAWETIQNGATRWVVVLGEPLPPGYANHSTAIAVIIQDGYPGSALDMAYFSPALVLASGRTIPNASFHAQFGGRVWQGWSRHRTPGNPWQPGVDSLKRISRSSARGSKTNPTDDDRYDSKGTP